MSTRRRPTRSFTVDTTAPETTVGSHPKPKTKSRKATFTFGSSEAGSAFVCSYDGKPYVACGASFTTPKLTRGRHRFDVLATDSVGNRDQSAATFLWKIKKPRAPLIQVGSRPMDLQSGEKVLYQGHRRGERSSAST